MRDWTVNFITALAWVTGSVAFAGLLITGIGLAFLRDIHTTERTDTRLIFWNWFLIGLGPWAWLIVTYLLPETKR